MNCDNNTDRTSKNGGGSTSATPSTVLLNRSVGTSPAPRMLTPYEIVLLRRSKSEMARVAHEVLTSQVSTARR